MKLEDLGYNPIFESDKIALKHGGLPVARVTSEHKGLYKVKNAEGEYVAKVTGKRIFDASSREDYPAVGDWVVIQIEDAETVVIEDILPRQTILKRKRNNEHEIQIIATNIDTAFIIESIGRDYNLNRFERYVTIAHDGGVEPVIVINKTDLLSEEELDATIKDIEGRFPTVTIIPTSALTGSGLEALRSHMSRGKTYCFVGSSGVGKSSLINKLLEESTIETSDVNVQTDRGKHTTTSREMYFLANGSIVIDNPGMREIGMTNTKESVMNLFDEIEQLGIKCKYSDCTHVSEPECVVKIALESGTLDPEKYTNYLTLKKEAEHFEMTDAERREKDYRFGKFMKKAKREIKKYKG